MADESIRRGLAQSAAGEVHDLGDFTQYVEYTPTLLRVENMYVAARQDQYVITDPEARAEFRRWLAGERASIWDECYAAMEFAIDGYYFGALPDNPYKED